MLLKEQKRIRFISLVMYINIKMAWQKWNGSLTLMVCTIVMKMDSV